MNKLILLLVFSIMITSCDRARNAAKEAVHKTGKVVGEGASEFAGGVSEGVDRTFECKIAVSRELRKKGMSYGKFRIREDSNMLSVYLVFDKDFGDTVTVKLIANDGMEYGRTSRYIRSAKGKAGYYDFAFDSRAVIESKTTFSFDVY